MNLSKSAIYSLLALSLAGSAFAQSQAVSSVPGPRELLGLGVNKQATGTQHRAVTASVATPGKAKVYQFASADFPGAATSLVFDRNSGDVIGDSVFTNSFGFTVQNGNYQKFVVPGSIGNELTGINTQGEIVGVYSDSANVVHGFLDNLGTFTTLDIGGAGTTTEPIGINDSGEIVGAYIDAANVNHGFSTPDGTNFAIFDPPGATTTQAAGVNSAGIIVGLYTDSMNVNHGFQYSGGVFTSIDFPAAKGTVAIGINDYNEIAGYFTDAASVNHGFIYANGQFTQVDVAGATGTQLTRIKNKGNVTGTYTDTSMESHGLVGH